MLADSMWAADPMATIGGHSFIWGIHLQLCFIDEAGDLAFGHEAPVPVPFDSS